MIDDLKSALTDLCSEASSRDADREWVSVMLSHAVDMVMRHGVDDWGAGDAEIIESVRRKAVMMAMAEAAKINGT